MSKVEINKDSVYIDGVEYVKKSDANDSVVSSDGLPYVLVRSNRAGVFIGFLKEKKYYPQGTVVILVDSRNIYYWDGAAGISQIAELGVSKPENCKITISVKEREISEVIEIIPITSIAKSNLDKILPWKK